MNILIMGKPGAGKGTQAQKLIEYFHLAHISTGNIYREEMAKDSYIGQIAKKYINDGNLVPDDITNGIVEKLLTNNQYPDGFMLDGYPRTVPQAEALDKLLAGLNLKLDAVINVQIIDEILLERMAGRRVCQSCGATYHISFKPVKKEGICDICGGKVIQRKDDEESSVLNRLSIYNEKTKPLLDYYNNKHILITIDGSESSTDVFDKIVKALGEKNGNN